MHVSVYTQFFHFFANPQKHFIPQEQTALNFNVTLNFAVTYLWDTDLLIQKIICIKSWSIIEDLKQTCQRALKNQNLHALLST